MVILKQLYMPGVEHLTKVLKFLIATQLIPEAYKIHKMLLKPGKDAKHFRFYRQYQRLLRLHSSAAIQLPTINTNFVLTIVPQQLLRAIFTHISRELNQNKTCWLPFTYQGLLIESTTLVEYVETNLRPNLKTWKINYMCECQSYVKSGT